MNLTVPLNNMDSSGDFINSVVLNKYDSGM